MSAQRSKDHLASHIILRLSEDAKKLEEILAKAQAEATELKKKNLALLVRLEDSETRRQAERVDAGMRSSAREKVLLKQLEVQVCEMRDKQWALAEQLGTALAQLAAHNLQERLDLLAAALLHNELTTISGFSAFDQDCDGKVSVEDLRKSLKDLELTMQDGEIQMIFNFIDMDHDGFISEMEWRVALESTPLRGYAMDIWSSQASVKQVRNEELRAKHVEYEKLVGILMKKDKHIESLRWTAELHTRLQEAHVKELSEVNAKLLEQTRLKETALRRIQFLETQEARLTEINQNKAESDQRGMSEKESETGKMQAALPRNLKDLVTEKLQAQNDQKDLLILSPSDTVNQVKAALQQKDVQLQLQASEHNVAMKKNEVKMREEKRDDKELTTNCMKEEEYKSLMMMMQMIHEKDAKTSEEKHTTELNALSGSMSEKIDVLLCQLRAHESDIEGLQQKLSDKERIIRDLTSRLDDAKARVAARESDVTMLKDETKALLEMDTLEIARLRGEITAQQEVHRSQISEMQKRPVLASDARLFAIEHEHRLMAEKKLEDTLLKIHGLEEQVQELDVQLSSDTARALAGVLAQCPALAHLNLRDNVQDSAELSRTLQHQFDHAKALLKARECEAAELEKLVSEFKVRAALGDEKMREMQDEMRGLQDELIRVKALLTASECRAADFEKQISELQKRVQASASCHFLLSVLD